MPSLRNSTIAIIAATAVLGCGSALAGSASVRNCSTLAAWAGAYNSNDTVKMIAASDACVRPKTTRRLTCATSNCVIVVKPSPTCRPWGTALETPATSGTWSYLGGYSPLVQGNACP